MRNALFALALLASPAAFAQEELSTEEEEVSPVTVSAVPNSSIERALADFVLRTGREPTMGTMRMVAPRVCRYRDIDIPTDTLHPHAGLVLRIFIGECLIGRDDITHHYVHDPRRQRVWLVDEEEILELLQKIPPLVEQSASS